MVLVDVHPSACMWQTVESSSSAVFHVSESRSQGFLLRSRDSCCDRGPLWNCLAKSIRSAGWIKFELWKNTEVVMLKYDCALHWLEYIHTAESHSHLRSNFRTELGEPWVNSSAKTHTFLAVKTGSAVWENSLKFLIVGRPPQLTGSSWCPAWLCE